MTSWLYLTIISYSNKRHTLKDLYINTHLPSQKLTKFIDKYWIIKNSSANTIELPIVPDGCMDIVYTQNNIMLSGAMDKSIIVPILPQEYNFETTA